MIQITLNGGELQWGPDIFAEPTDAGLAAAPQMACFEPTPAGRALIRPGTPRGYPRTEGAPGTRLREREDWDVDAPFRED